MWSSLSFNNLIISCEVKVTCIDYNANHRLRVPHSAAPQEQVFTMESNPSFTRMLPVYIHIFFNSLKCLVYHLQKQFTAYSHEASEPSQVIVGIFTLNATAVVFWNKFRFLKEDHIHKFFKRTVQRGFYGTQFNKDFF